MQADGVSSDVGSGAMEALRERQGCARGAHEDCLASTPVDRLVGHADPSLQGIAHGPHHARSPGESQSQGASVAPAAPTASEGMARGGPKIAQPQPIDSAQSQPVDSALMIGSTDSAPRDRGTRRRAAMAWKQQSWQPWGQWQKFEK